MHAGIRTNMKIICPASFVKWNFLLGSSRHLFTSLFKVIFKRLFWLSLWDVPFGHNFWRSLLEAIFWTLLLDFTFRSNFLNVPFEHHFYFIYVEAINRLIRDGHCNRLNQSRANAVKLVTEKWYIYIYIFFLSIYLPKFFSSRPTNHIFCNCASWGCNRLWGCRPGRNRRGIR